MACGACGFLTYGLAPTGSFFLLGLPLQALWGLSGPAAQGLMTRRVTPSDQGRLQGAQSSLMGISGLLGPSLFTRVFAAAIRPELGWQLPGAPFLVASLILACAFLLSWRVTTAARSAASS